MKRDLRRMPGERAAAPLSEELQDYLDQLLQSPSVEPARMPPRTASPAAHSRSTPDGAERLERAAGAPPAGRHDAARFARSAMPPPIPALPYAEPPDRLPRPLPSLAPAAPLAESASLKTMPLRSTTIAPAKAPRPAAPVARASAISVAASVPAQTVAAADPGSPREAPVAVPARPTGAFEVLLFRVGGLSLAVPLTALGVIRPLTEAPTPLFGQAPWYIGVIAEKQGTARVVDTAQLVMPERYRSEMREAYRYVIALHGSEWALAVDEIMGTVKLQPTEVRWRSQGGKRPWLAGTVVDHMCALLDADGLASALQPSTPEGGA